MVIGCTLIYSMRHLDPDKRQEILEAAARLFASHPFHEVLLDAVAADAHVGKGTIYLYFHDKDALYLSVVREAFSRLVGSLARKQSNPVLDPWDRLGDVADGLIRFATAFPDLFRVMRGGVRAPDDPELQRLRRELVAFVEEAIRNGNATGQMNDPFPELTAQFVLSFVRGAMLYPPVQMTSDSLRTHLLRVLRSGIGAGATA